MATFSFKDGVLTVVRAQIVTVGSVSQAIPAGPPFRLLSPTKIDADGGGKGTYLKGMPMNPLAVLINTSEGKLSIECSNALEVSEARKTVGGIGSTVIFTLVLARTFVLPTSFQFAPATWVNGGLFSGSDASGWTDKIEVMFTDAKQDNVSIYNQAA